MTKHARLIRQQKRAIALNRSIKKTTISGLTHVYRVAWDAVTSARSAERYAEDAYHAAKRDGYR